MTPTPLRDRLLFLEARLAMVEDRLDDLRARLRHSLKTTLIAAELLAMVFMVRLLDRHFSKKGR